MKANEIVYLFLIVIFLISCSSGNQSKDGLPCIDIRKNYPEKEIILTDIADVTYVHLNTTDDDYLYKGRLVYVTDNTIVMSDESSGSILFFSKDGNPKSRFNRFGSGPEEYTQKRPTAIIYDESADDVFLHASGIYNPGSIPVYSSTGEYKRRLILPKGASPMPIVDFDDQSLLVYDMQKQLAGVMRAYTSQSGRETDIIPQAVDARYYHISKTDGDVLEYVEILSNEADLTRSIDGGFSIPVFERITKGAEGLFLCDIETDTVFLYSKNKTLTPIICKIPSVNDLDPKIILTDFVEAGRYQFMLVLTMMSREETMRIPLDELYKRYNRHYMRDKQTGEIFRQKIRWTDYTEKELFITARNMYFTGKETLAYFELDLFELKKAYQENKLNGKLKELVATLDEMEDNNVFMFVTFKE